MDLSQFRNPAVKKLMRDSQMCPLFALVPSLRKCSHLGDPGDPASLIAQLVKNLPAMQETPVQFLDQKDPLEKGWAPYSSVLGLP